jgi:hypothetical protein
VHLKMPAGTRMAISTFSHDNRSPKLRSRTRPASPGGPLFCFHSNDLNPNYHAAADKRILQRR